MSANRFEIAVALVEDIRAHLKAGKVLRASNIRALERRSLARAEAESAAWAAHVEALFGPEPLAAVNAAPLVPAVIFD